MTEQLLDVRPTGRYDKVEAAYDGMEHHNREVFRRIIAAPVEEYGHEVVEAADGREGIDRFAEVPPDLVILDFVMPGLSGAEVAAHIRAAKPGQRILFVSGYSETDAIRQVAPDAEILPKPFRATVLDEAVRDALATS